MEFFTIERLHLCLSRLLATIPSNMTFPAPRPPGSGVACGVEYDADYPHFSGNFWAATCDFIARTRQLLRDASDTAAEFFLTEGPEPPKEDAFVNLAKYEGPTSLYRHVMLPQYYRFSREQEKENYANVRFPVARILATPTSVGYDK
jgi:hypothetical protein